VRRTPTAAVRRRFGISRGYARRLIKAAEAEASIDSFYMPLHDHVVMW
jgi:hypothetical protein